MKKKQLFKISGTLHMVFRQKPFITLCLFAPLYALGQQSDLTKAAKALTDSPKIDTCKSWDIGGFVNVSFSQSSFSYWAAGGVNSLGLTSIVSVHANYHKKNKVSWLNDLELGYGFQKSGEMPVQKTIDQIEATSSIGYQAFDHTSATFLANFITQFQPGYSNAGDSVEISNFMSPGYLVLAAGLNYKPDKALSIFLSPIAARFVFVENQVLADQGDYGVEPAVYNNSGMLTQHGKKELTEVGAYFKGGYIKDLVKNISLSTTLELFSNYLKNPQDIVVNWTGMLNLKVTKYISASIQTQLIYDNNTLLPVYNEEGVLIGKGPRTQFKDVLGIGLAYKF